MLCRLIVICNSLLKWEEFVRYIKMCW